MKRKRDHKRTGNFLESAMVIDLTQDSSSDELRGDVTAKYSVKVRNAAKCSLSAHA